MLLKPALASMRRFREFVGEEVWRLFGLACIVGFLLFLVESSFVLILQGFLLAVNLVPADRLLLPAWYPRSVNGALILLVAFGLFRGCIFAAKGYLAGVTNQAFMRTQRMRIMDYGLRRAGETSVPEMVILFTDRVSQVGGAFFGASQILIFFISITFLVGLAIYMAPIELALGLFFLILFLFPLRILNRRIDASGRGLIKEGEGANRSLIGGLRHFFFFNVYCLIDREIARGKRALEGYSNHYRSYYFFSSIKNSIPLSFGVIIVSVITLVSVRYIGTTPAKIVSFFYLFLRIAQGGSEINASLNDARVQYPAYVQLREFFERIKKTEKEPRKIKLATNEKKRFLATVERNGISIQVQDLYFSYSEKKLLHGQTFKVDRGDRLVIQGESGSGKSTLLALILGLLEPQEGTVAINGFPVREIREELAPIIGYVGPEAFLTEGTVRENLMYGLAEGINVSNEQIWESLQKAQIVNLVQQFPNQLEERLYELTQLSTGQKQRLAIARALLRNPKLLILDEASANLDPATEKSFIDSLEPLFADTTVLVISHKDSFNRISTIRLKLGNQS